MGWCARHMHPETASEPPRTVGNGRVRTRASATTYAAMIVAVACIAAMAAAPSFTAGDAVFLVGLIGAGSSSSGGAHAQEQQSVTASAMAHGLNNIVTITNTEEASGGDITTVRMWLSTTDGAAFKSFKTESGWTGQRTPQGVIIFTATMPIQPGESAKFGIETDIPISGINWRAVDVGGNDLGIGKVIPTEMTAPIPMPPDGGQNAADVSPPSPPPPPPPPPPPSSPSITSESDFRIIPVKPNVGSTIRVAGEKFGPNMHFDFYVNNRVLAGFESRGDGTFVATANIPDDIQPDRVSFVVRDVEGKEIVRSLRLNPAEQRPNSAGLSGPGSQASTISISQIPGIVEIGDRFSISGTGNPDSTVVVYTTDHNGAQVSADIVQVDGSGTWSIPGTYLVGADMEIGQYATTATDGVQTASSPWSVAVKETISVQASQVKYERGDSMRFNITTTGSGTAPEEPVKVQLEDPNNMVIYSDILETGGSRSVMFVYNTTFGNTEGTYTLIATHGKYKEYSFVGVGEMPKIKIRFDLDKVNYRSNDVVTADIRAKPGDSLKFNILDKSDRIINENHRNRFVNVQSDGRASVVLDLVEFENGIFTAELEKGTEKVSKEFTVGLQSGTTNIDITPIKPPYNLGEQFLVSIDTGDTNVPLTITMIDPDGKTIITKETFSDSIRVQNDDQSKALETLLIPSSGKLGTWTISVNSGGNVFSTPIEVIPEGMSIQVLGINDDPSIGIGRYIDVMVSGAEQTVWLEMVTQDGIVIVDEQRVSITGDKIASAKVVIPSDVVSGTYIVKAWDTYSNTAEVEVTIE